jgi:hypothetical protein
MLHLAGVKAVRYIGVQAKKLWEVGGRNVPILARGDVVLVGETVALSLTRGRFFEPYLGDITQEIPDLPELETSTEESGDINPPADLVTPEAPVVTPEAPVVTPEAPVVTPEAPVVTPEAPGVTPKNQGT